MRLAGDEVQMPQYRRPELGVKGIIAHGEVLSIIPECRDRVAIIVTHGEVRSASGAGGTGKLQEFVCQAVIKGQLFRSIVVRVSAGDRLASIKAKGSSPILIPKQ